jgi:hypothetical protein
MGARRKSGGGRVTAKGGTSRGRLTADEKTGLEAIFSRILRSALDDLSDGLDPLGAELWASQMWSIWQRAELIGMDATAVFAGGPHRLRHQARFTRGARGPAGAGSGGPRTPRQQGAPRCRSLVQIRTEGTGVGS